MRRVHTHTLAELCTSYCVLGCQSVRRTSSCKFQQLGARLESGACLAAQCLGLPQQSHSVARMTKRHRRRQHCHPCPECQLPCHSWLFHRAAMHVGGWNLSWSVQQQQRCTSLTGSNVGHADNQPAGLAGTQRLPGVRALPLEWFQPHCDHLIHNNSMDLLVSSVLCSQAVAYEMW